MTDDVIPPERLNSARSAIYELLGRRNPLGPVQAIDLYPVPREAEATIHLSGRPVREIISVHINDREYTHWELTNGFMLKLGSNCCGGRDERGFPSFFGPNGGAGWQNQYGYGYSGGYPDTRIGNCRCWAKVEYVYGTPPSYIVQCAIDALAAQICDSCGCVGDCECHLPDNITSVNRQGVSWNIEEVDAILEDGSRTGIPEVDRMLSYYNPDKARRRARVFSYRNPPARRLSAIRLPNDWEPSE